MEDHLRHKERTVQAKTLGDNDFRTFEKQNEDVRGQVGLFVLFCLMHLIPQRLCNLSRAIIIEV